MHDHTEVNPGLARRELSRSHATTPVPPPPGTEWAYAPGVPSEAWRADYRRRHGLGAPIPRTQPRPRPRPQPRRRASATSDCPARPVPNPTRHGRHSAPLNATLEQVALHEAAQLDATAAEADAIGYWVLVRPAAARRVARALRSLALLSREGA